MEDLGGMRFKIINQMVKTFIEQEKKFFETCYNLINNFFYGKGVLDQSLPYQKTSYDPMKYIRANKLMEGVDAKSLPDIKMKDKYSFNNFKSGNSMPINNSNFNKKYSFEDYKLRKSTTQQNNNSINNNQNHINNISTINNNKNIQNNEKPLNPYSYEAYKKRTQSLDTLKRPQQNNNNKNNGDFYQSNLNLVMNSIIGKESIVQQNPFSNIGNININPFSTNNNINNNNNNFLNPYEKNNNDNNNNHDNSNNIQNPYSSIFNFNNNNNNNNNSININNNNSIFNPYSGNYEQKNNNNNNFKKPSDKYNFGF